MKQTFKVGDRVNVIEGANKPEFKGLGAVTQIDESYLSQPCIMVKFDDNKTEIWCYPSKVGGNFNVEIIKATPSRSEMLAYFANMMIFGIAQLGVNTMNRLADLDENEAFEPIANAYNKYTKDIQEDGSLDAFINLEIYERFKGL